jgi:hypothetical protein
MRKGGRGSRERRRRRPQPVNNNEKKELVLQRHSHLGTLSGFARAMTLALLLGACSKSAPSPWKEMNLPVEHASRIDGNAEQIQIRWEPAMSPDVLAQSFSEALTKAGYTRLGSTENDSPLGAHPSYEWVFARSGSHDGVVLGADPGGVNLKHVDDASAKLKKR